MPSFLGFWGLGASAPPSDESQTDEASAVRALPASWYTSKEMYQLERRAIFSRKWMIITHSMRLKQPGDYLRYDIANFEFILVKDRDGNINGFHNVCRHRAFPVVTQEKGQAKIFSCLYHGWSYGLNGKLAKAPGFQDLPTFDKSKNGLLPIHVHIDHNGFIWVNLDSNRTPEVAWSDDFHGVDDLPRYDNVNWDDYEFDHTWEMDGGYNWKILADNYNECYHCKTAHPDIPDIADITTYSVKPVAGSIQHDAGTTESQKAAGLTVAPTYYFPNASMTVSPHFFYMQRFVPSSPTACIMRYEVYRNKSSSDTDFTRIDGIYKRVMAEDKYLCDLTQKNLNTGVFVNGELHPKMEMGPLYFQKSVKSEVVGWWEREAREGKENWPARMRLDEQGGSVLVSGREVEFCEGLACEKGEVLKEGLAW